MRALGIAGVAAATLMAQQVMPGLVVSRVPTQAAYTLDGACYWHPKPWVLYLGPSLRALPDTAAQAAEARCWRAHGARSTTPFLKIVQPTWPSTDQFARWESEDAAALHAPHAGQD